MDTTTIMSGLAAGSHAMGLLKGLAESLKASGKSEAIQQVIDAQLAMMELIERLQKSNEENLQLKEQIKALQQQNHEIREAQKVGLKLKRIGNAYFLEDDSGKKHPYCLTCWDSDRKLINLTESYYQGKVWSRECGICAARKS